MTLPNHTSISVTFAGDVQISPQLTLTDVLFVPQFKFNLIFVSALTNTSTLTVTLFPSNCLIQDNKSLKVIGKGRQLADLYAFHHNHPSTAFINSVSLHTWHNRLGNLSNKCLDYLKTHLSFDSVHTRSYCPICPLAK